MWHGTRGGHEFYVCVQRGGIPEIRVSGPEATSPHSTVRHEHSSSDSSEDEETDEDDDDEEDEIDDADEDYDDGGDSGEATEGTLAESPGNRLLAVRARTGPTTGRESASSRATAAASSFH
jgi:hypothetical protein